LEGLFQFWIRREEVLTTNHTNFHEKENTGFWVLGSDSCRLAPGSWLLAPGSVLAGRG
jgi:hypothetical protein